MVALGTDSGVATTALLTDMNTPLGLAIGNANEVRESVEVLAGGGPADVVELTVALAREMLALAGQPDADVEAALRDGRAMDVWRAMIRAQDGDPDAALPAPRETQTVTATAAGVVTRMDALPFGDRRVAAGRGPRPRRGCRHPRRGHRPAREARRRGRRGSARLHPSRPTTHRGSSGPSAPSRAHGRSATRRARTHARSCSSASRPDRRRIR